MAEPDTETDRRQVRMNGLHPGTACIGRPPQERIPESVWQALIIASTAIVLIFSTYCLSHGITIIFMHLYYFPIVLLAYRYRYRGFVSSVLLSLVYVGLVYYYDAGQADVITGAWYRFLVFAGIAAIVAYLSEQLVVGQKALRESETKFRTLADFTSDWEYWIGTDGSFIYVTPSCEQITGYTPEEFCSDPGLLARIIHHEDSESYAGHVKNYLAISEPGSLEFRIIRKDGRECWIGHVCQAMFDSQGNLVGRRGSNRDITERKLVEEHRIQQFRLLQQLIDTIPNPVFYKDRNGIYTGCNTAFEGYIGLPKDRLVGKSVYDIAPKELADIYFAADRKLLDNPGTQVYESRVKYADGSIHDVIFNKATFTDLKGDVDGLVGVILDISDRKKAEEEERLMRERFETLVKVSEMRDASETELSEHVMEAACRMTGSTLAFIGTMTPDESVMDIVAWSESAMQECRVAASPIHFPIEKAGIWADAVRTRLPKIVNDYPAPHPGKKGLPEGHVAITRFLALPVLDNGKAVMVAAVANKPSDYDDADVTRLTLLMQGVWGNLRRRRADEALKKSEILLNETGAMAKVGGWEIDVQTKDVRMTRETYRIHEIPDGEKYHLSRAASFFDMPGWSLLEAALQRCTENGEPFDLELPFTTATGRHLWTRAIGRAVVADGKIVKVAGTFQDITERKRAEESVRKTIAILKGVVESPKDVVIFALDCQYRYIAFNENHRITMKRIWGVDIVLGNSMLDYIRNPEDREKAVINFDRALAGESFTVTEAYGDTALERRWYEDIYNPIIDEKGNVIGLTLFLTDVTDRRQMEEALRESEGKFRGVAERSSDIIMLTDETGRVTYIAPSVKGILGYDPGETVGTKPEDVVHPDDIEAVLGLIRKFAAGKTGTENIEVRVRKKDGGYAILDLSISPIIREGIFSGMQVIGRDVTERKHAEEALKESRRMYRELVENINDVILSLDLQGNFTYVSPVVERLYGYIPEEMIGKHFSEYVHPEDHPPCIEAFKKRLKGEFGLNEFRIVTKDGRTEHVMVSQRAIMKDGAVAGFNYIMTNITARKRTEEALRESREILEGVLNSITVRVFWKDKNSVYLGCNTVFARDAGFEKPEDLIGKDDFAMGWRDQAELYRGDDRTVIETGKVKLLYEEPQTTPTGEKIHLLTSKVPLRDAGGEIIGVLGTYLDITALKRAEEALRESEQKFRDIFNNTTDAIQIHEIRDDGTPGLFADVNEVACRMLGYTREELLTKTPLDIATAYHDPPLERIFEDQRTLGVARFETEHRAKDGKVIPVEVNTHVVTIQGRKVMLGVVRDITERKVQEHILRTQLKLGLDLQKIHGLRETLDACLSAAIGISGMDAGGIYLVDRTSGSIDLVVHQNLGTEFVQSVSHYAAGSAHAQIVMAAKPVYVPYSKTGIILIPPVQKQEGLLAVAIIPITSGGRVIACLNVTSHSLEEIPVNAQIALETIATQIGAAIERIGSEEALAESEQKFRDIFNNTTDAIHIHEIGEDGMPGRFTDVNDVTCQMLGYTKEELRAKTPLDVATAYHNPPVEKILEDQRTLGVARFETGYRRKDDAIIPVEINTHVVTIQGKKVMLGVVRDITERKKAEALLRDFNEELEHQVAAQTEKINASLNEKILLLREIHHRVKNNLQIIISLTNLQLRQTGDERLKQVMKETQNRVRAMSLVHERLYQSEDIARISLADYTRFLATQLFAFYGVDSRQVKLEIDIGRIMLDINTAIPAGLILNELVSNALKHAFPDNMPGLLSITAREEGNTISLTIRDTGIGMPEGFSWEESPTLGLRLVSILVDQLNGTIKLQPATEGTVFAIRIRKAGEPVGAVR